MSRDDEAFDGPSPLHGERRHEVRRHESIASCAECMTMLTSALNAGLTDLRREIKGDIRDAMAPVWNEIGAMGRRVNAVEVSLVQHEAAQTGGSKVWAVVGGAAFSMVLMLLGAWLGGKF